MGASESMMQRANIQAAHPDEGFGPGPSGQSGAGKIKFDNLPPGIADELLQEYKMRDEEIASRRMMQQANAQAVHALKRRTQPRLKVSMEDLDPGLQAQLCDLQQQQKMQKQQDELLRHHDYNQWLE